MGELDGAPIQLHLAGQHHPGALGEPPAQAFGVEERRTDLVAAGADGELTRRGFKNVDGFKSGNTAYTIWSRRDTHQCVQMTVAEGRVEDVRDIGTHPKCR